MNEDPHDPRFRKLLNFLERIPPVQVNSTAGRGFGSGFGERGWWVKFALDIEHPLAWQAVQETSPGRRGRSR